MTIAAPGLQDIHAVARELGLADEDVVPYGRDKAKIDVDRALERDPRGAGRLILVSAINPTPAGEGKTTMSIGLAMGLRRLGERVALCLREPSLGPVFGIKGGGTGGGRASLHPADDINLHFTGDLHAITCANNLLSAAIDNALHFRTCFAKDARIDARRVRWARALDMNDRALRRVMVGLGGTTHGVPREERFDITAASEVMAILALARSTEDLEQRLGRVVAAETEAGDVVTAGDLEVHRAMTALLRDARQPNLVQTLEGGPALVHAGPFANIATGTSSVLATELGMHSSDYVVTEAGFGLDLGGEKFLDIKARVLGAWPRLLVLVSTVRALEAHGGAAPRKAGDEAPIDLDALERGLAHLTHHVRVAQGRGLPVVVVQNVFPSDSDEALTMVERHTSTLGAVAVRCDAFARGGEGSVEFARTVRELLLEGDAQPPTPRYTYELDAPIVDKLGAIARTYYGADGVELGPRARKDLERLERAGVSDLPVCVAKTHLSLSDDPTRRGVPTGARIAVRELRESRGAGFVVALAGEISTMPGLPRRPAAAGVRLEGGRIRGLMQGD